MDITVQDEAPIVSTVMGIVWDAADIGCKNIENNIHVTVQGEQKIQSLADTEQFNRDAIKDILAVLPPERAAIVISVLADMSKLTAQTLNAGMSSRLPESYA